MRRVSHASKGSCERTERPQPEALGMEGKVGFQWASKWPCIAQTWATLANNLSLEGTERFQRWFVFGIRQSKLKSILSVGTENVFFAEKTVNLYKWMIV